MAGETRIIAIGAGDEGTPADDFLDLSIADVVTSDEPNWPEEVTEPQAFARSAWLSPALAASAIAVWTGLFIWANSMGTPLPQRLSDWLALVSDWAMPVLLICVAWLLAMRNSRREAARFGDAAHLLSTESSRLESRLVAMNRELSLAREFIASQARDLESLGRIAGDRLTQHADRLRTLVHENGERVETLGTISETALGNMEKLRSQLPVIASSAKDVTNNIGNAGRAAHAQLADLIGGFNRLNEFGQASERQVDTLRTTIDSTIAEFTQSYETLDQVSDQRIASLSERSDEFRTRLNSLEADALIAIRERAGALETDLASVRRELDDHEEQALTSLRARLGSIRDESKAITRSLREGGTRAIDSWQTAIDRLAAGLGETSDTLARSEEHARAAQEQRISELTEAATRIETQMAGHASAFSEQIAVRRSQAEADSEAALIRFTDQLSSIDALVAERRQAHQRQSEALDKQGTVIESRLAEFENRIAETARQGTTASTALSASVESLTGHLSESGPTIERASADIAALTDASVRLLELLRASAEQSGRQLPAALHASEEHLAGLENRVRLLAKSVSDARTSGESLVGLVNTSGEGIRAMYGDVEALQVAMRDRNEDQRVRIAELGEALAHVEEQTCSLASRTQGDLSDAIERLTMAARDAVASIGESGPMAVAGIVEKLEADSAAAVDRSVRASAADSAGQLERAIAQAAGAGRDATVQLRDQLSVVNELVGNLERRVAHARTRAEEQVDNDFARRAALITESLNSSSIDIAKALSADVADTAWAAYLRGDRGIFTRRAVNMLETGEAREITQIYEADEEFREHVNRYIHDFEAILRQVLSTRDGHALGVTLLSSDMGKLYVALAQAIERLRG